MKKNQLKKLMNNLDKNAETCKKVDSNINEINQIINYAPTDIINSFKTYTDPQRNVSQIIEFYKLVINCTENTKEQMKCIYALEDNTHQNQINAIHAHHNIKMELRNLEEYSDINVISRFTDKTNKRIFEIVDVIFHAFFKGFEKGRDTNELKLMSMFLLENDETPFILKYVKVMFFRYNSKKEEKDSKKVLENLKKLKNTFKEIHDINVVYLNYAKTELVDKQVQQMLAIEYKNIISRILMNLDQRYKDKNIVEACDWYIALKDKDISKIFVEFDEEILKVIYNLQIKFINNIDAVKKPNRNLMCEDFNNNLKQVLNLFQNPDLHAFFEQYSNQLDYHDYEEMKTVLSSTALDKVFDLSSNLKGIQKSIYLLNNLYPMVDFCKEYRGEKIVVHISRLCDGITKMWKDECDKKKGDATKFLNVNFEVQRDYYLPDEIRTPIIEGINKIVYELMERCEYKDGKDMLELRLHELFRGK